MDVTQPVDALGPEILTEMYKELKDNRNVNDELRTLLSNHVAQYVRCHIDDFFNAIKCSDSLIIAFYRKYSKLKPRTFVR